MNISSYGHKEIGLQKKGQRRRDNDDFEMEEGAISQGMWVPLGAGKGKEMTSLLTLPEGIQPLLTS